MRLVHLRVGGASLLFQPVAGRAAGRVVPLEPAVVLGGDNPGQYGDGDSRGDGDDDRPRLPGCSGGHGPNAKTRGYHPNGSYAVAGVRRTLKHVQSHLWGKKKRAAPDI